MRKIISVFLLLSLLLCVTGCEGANDYIYPCYNCDNIIPKTSKYCAVCGVEVLCGNCGEFIVEKDGCCAACGASVNTDFENNTSNTTSLEQNTSSETLEQETSSNTQTSSTAKPPVSSDMVSSKPVEKPKPELKPGIAYDDVIDLDGYKFVLTSPFILNDPDLSTLMNSEMVFEEMRRKIEKDYNCKIQITSYTVTLNSLRAKVQSGAKVGDIIDITSREMIPCVRAGLLLELDNVDGINVMSEYWDEGSRNVATYANHVYALNFMKPVEVRSCIAYNKDVLEQYGVTEDLVQMVREKQWTWENWLPMLKKTTNTASNNFGLVSTRSDIMAFNFISSNDGSVIQENESGAVKETLNSLNTVEALNFFYDLVQTHKVYDVQNSGNVNSIVKGFVDGNYAFMHCESWVLTQQVKDIAGDTRYGMLPFPIGPNGSDYKSNCDHMRFFCITKSNNDLDKTVPVFNALGRYIYNYGDGNWWYEDIEMDYFQPGDKESVEMYLLTLEGSTVDYGLTIDSVSTAFTQNIIGRTILKKRSTIASTVNALHGTFDSDIATIFELQK